MLLGNVVMFLALLLLLSAGWRIASRIDHAGLERSLETVALAAAGATMSALVLGLFSLGTNRWALLAAAACLALFARWRLPTPTVGLTDDLSGWWRRSLPLERASVGAGIGSICFLTVAAFVRPQFGFDSTVYHFPEVINWVHSGRPGSVVDISYDYPFGYYPLGGEVLMAWGAGMARSFLPLVLVKLLGFPLFAASVVLLLRHVTDSLAVKALAVAALVVQPIVIYATVDFTGDLLATGWATLAAALALGTTGNPRRFAVALMAAGLAAGTKPTALLPLAVVLGWAAWTNRRALREELGWIAAIGLPGVFLGGIWMARNTIEHGLPLWPLQAAPWGDPVPPLFERLKPRLIDVPWETVSFDPKSLLLPVVGTAVLIVAGALTPLWKRSKRMLQGSALLLLSVAIWSATPGTGINDSVSGTIGYGRISWLISMLRYLLPATVIAAACLSASATNGWRRILVGSTFVISAIASISMDLGFPERSVYNSVNTPVKDLAVPLALTAALSALIMWGSGRSRSGNRRQTEEAGSDGTSSLAGGLPPMPKLASAVLVVAVLAGLGTWAASGYVTRWAEASQAGYDAPDLGMQPLPDGETAAQALVRQPAWRANGEPIVFASHVMISAFAGSDLRHNLILLPRRADCGTARRAATLGWLVTTPNRHLVPTVDSFRDGYTGHECAMRDLTVRYPGVPSIFRDPDPWVPPPGRQ